MAKNKVQFQKSMTIHAFMNQFGSEAQVTVHQPRLD